METPNFGFITGEEIELLGSDKEAVEDSANVNGKLEIGDIGEIIPLSRMVMTRQHHPQRD